MEPWKVLLLVAAVPAAASIALSSMNRSQLLETIENREAAEVRVENTRKQLDRTKEELATTESTIRSLGEETEQTRTQLVSTRAQISDLEVKIQTLTDDIAAADMEIAKFEEFKRIVGEIEEVDRRIAEVKSEISSLESDVGRVENMLAIASAKKEQGDTIIERKEAMSKFRRSGQMWQDIDTRVKAAYNTWGFVILEAGDSDGLVPAATLDILRDGRPICKVLVTEVEPNQSVADIVSGTLLPGQQVQVGDQAVKKATVALP